MFKTMKMNKIRAFFYIIFFLGIAQLSVAQTALESLVGAEKAFAKMSEETNTKNAFVHFLSDSSIIFRPGPVSGKATWEAAEADNDLLSWKPAFADIAAAGDLGYTTGPFEYKAGRTDEKPAGTGHYVSVWKKEKDGTWKVALDIGIGHPPAPEKQFATSTIAPKAVIQKQGANAAVELMQTDLTFCEQQNKNGLSVYNQWLSSEAKIYRPGEAPYDTKETIQPFLSATDKQFTFQPVRADVAASGDLGYVYGGGSVAIKQGENVKNMDINYLRIWKKEGGHSWKIVLDLVTVIKR